MLPTWGFLVPAVWGFNARWLPIFLGLKTPNARRLYAALFVAWAAVAAMLSGVAILSAVLLLIAAFLAVSALHVFEPAMQPAKVSGVHASFPVSYAAPTFGYWWRQRYQSLPRWRIAKAASGALRGTR